MNMVLNALTGENVNVYTYDVIKMASLFEGLMFCLGYYNIITTQKNPITFF